MTPFALSVLAVAISVVSLLISFLCYLEYRKQTKIMEEQQFENENPYSRKKAFMTDLVEAAMRIADSLERQNKRDKT